MRKLAGVKRLIIPALALIVVTGCSTSKRNPSVPGMSGPSAIEADLAFSRLAKELTPAEAFARYTDARSIELPPAGPPVVGQRAISANLEGVPPGALDWQPQGGETALSGELAWTWGTYTMHSTNGDVTGKYMSIWHRRPDGSWFLAADMGNQVVPKK